MRKHLSESIYLDALAYPFRSGGWMIILIGAVISIFTDLASVIGLLLNGYLLAYFFSIINDTMVGKDTPPELPGFSNFWDDILRPLFLMIGVIFIAFLPTLAVVFFGIEESWFEPVLYVTIAWGCLYLPLGIIATQAIGGVRSALPHIVVPAIIRVMPAYLLTAGILIGFVVLIALLQHHAVQVPYAGWFLTYMVGIYSLMFQGRLIGLIYLKKQERLGW